MPDFKNVIVVKSEKDQTPVQATDEQIAQLVSVWGAENVLDAETLEPVVKPEVPEVVAAVADTNEQEAEAPVETDVTTAEQPTVDEPSAQEVVAESEPVADPDLSAPATE